MTSATINWQEHLHAALASAAENPELVAFCVSDEVKRFFAKWTDAYPEWTWIHCPSFVCARACGASVHSPAQQVYAALWADESGLAQWQDDLRMLRSLDAESLTVLLSGPCAEAYLTDWKQQNFTENLACYIVAIASEDTDVKVVRSIEECIAQGPLENEDEIEADATRCWKARPSHYQWRDCDSVLAAGNAENPEALREHILAGVDELEIAMTVRADNGFPLEAGGMIAWAQVAAQGRLVVLDAVWDDLSDPRVRAQCTALAEAGLPIKCVLHGSQNFESASFFADLSATWLHYPADAGEALAYWQQDLCHNWPSFLSLPATWCSGLNPSEGKFSLRTVNAEQERFSDTEDVCELFIVCMPMMYESCIAAQTALSRIDITVSIRVLSNILPTPRLEFSDVASVLMVDAYAQPYLSRRFQRQMVEKNWKTTRILDGFACGGKSPAVADIAAAVRSLAEKK